jgi:hypothetical protein
MNMGSNPKRAPLFSFVLASYFAYGFAFEEVVLPDSLSQ